VRDVCLLASDRRARLEIAIAVTTEVGRAAQRAHGFGTTSAIGLGRLLTATGLLALTSKRPGTTSVQILAKGRVGQLYADATENGEVRGYSRKPKLMYPLIAKDQRLERASIGAMVMPGTVSVVRSNAKGEYVQSASPLTSGEIDRDVESFIAQSEQIPTVVACETLLDGEGDVFVAGGVLVRAMPDSDLEALYDLRDRLVDGALAKLLVSSEDIATLFAAVAPGAELVEPETKIVWKCRCSFERVLGAFELLGPEDLADMASKNEPTGVDCDFCGQHYEVTSAQVMEIFKSKIQAHG
jgi:molecular chaperone Hsp33